MYMTKPCCLVEYYSHCNSYLLTLTFVEDQTSNDGVDPWRQRSLDIVKSIVSFKLKIKAGCIIRAVIFPN